MQLRLLPNLLMRGNGAPRTLKPARPGDPRGPERAVALEALCGAPARRLLYRRCYGDTRDALGLPPALHMRRTRGTAAPPDMTNTSHPSWGERCLFPAVPPNLDARSRKALDASHSRAITDASGSGLLSGRGGPSRRSPCGRFVATARRLRPGSSGASFSSPWGAGFQPRPALCGPRNCLLLPFTAFPTAC